MIIVNYKRACVLVALLFLSISSFSQVGVGTTIPKSSLDVEGSVAIGTAYSGDIEAPTNGAIIEGNVGVGTSEPTSRLHIDGGTTALPVTIETSSSRSGMVIRNSATTGTDNLTDIRFQNNDGTAISDAGHIYFSDANYTTGAGVANHMSIVNRRSGGIGWYSDNTSGPTGNRKMMLDNLGNLDITSALRVRATETSSSTNDFQLVVDTDGHVKKQLNSVEGNFRGSLSTDYDSRLSSNNANSNGLFAINGITEFYDAGNDFNEASSTFVAPITGIYEVAITLTIKGFSTPDVNYVTGLLDSSGDWVFRFSMQREEPIASAAATGTARTYLGIASLVAGESYNFGFGAGSFNLIANPTGSSGSGVGSYFSIKLIDNN